MHQNNGTYKTFDYQPLHIGSSLKQLSTGYNQIYFLKVAKIDTCADDYKLTHSRQRQRYLKKFFIAEITSKGFYFKYIFV